MLLVDDLAAGGTKNLRHTPRGLVTLRGGPTFSGGRGGGGGGGFVCPTFSRGVQLLIPYRNPYNL